jgi:hypothetical protein
LFKHFFFVRINFFFMAWQGRRKIKILAKNKNKTKCHRVKKLNLKNPQRPTAAPRPVAAAAAAAVVIAAAAAAAAAVVIAAAAKANSKEAFG